jgi:hypothetical protein
MLQWEMERLLASWDFWPSENTIPPSTMIEFRMRIHLHRLTALFMSSLYRVCNCKTYKSSLFFIFTLHLHIPLSAASAGLTGSKYF